MIIDAAKRFKIVSPFPYERLSSNTSQVTKQYQHILKFILLEACCTISLILIKSMSIITGENVTQCGTF